MKLEQIEKAFSSRGIEYTRHLSGISKSAYYTFVDAKGNDLTIRISDHELPASYNTGRNESFSVDFRYTDKMSLISSYIEKNTGKKVKRTKNVEKILSIEDSKYIISESLALNRPVETVLRIYGKEGYKLSC